MTFQITTYNNIHHLGLAELGEGFAVDQGNKEQADAYILRSQNLHGEVFPASLKAIARAGAGTNNIPIEEATAQGIVVFNTPGANANAVKEAVLTSLFLAARDYLSATKWANTLTGSDVPQQIEAGKSQFAGTELAGKTLGIIGLGAIGARIANDARRLGMQVLGYDPYVSIETAWSISSHVKRVNDLREIFSQSDYITLHVPLTPDTRDLLDSSAFALMKKGAVLINFARAELVAHEALFEAIAKGTIKQYITDFGTEELLNKEGITVFPHVGGSTEEAELNCAIMASQTVRQFLLTGEITNSVNFPNVHQALSAPYRITLINQNVPNMVAKITAAVSQLGINIDNIINRSKGEFAYTLLDLEEDDRSKIDQLLATFEADEQIVRVRLIVGK